MNNTFRLFSFLFFIILFVTALPACKTHAGHNEYLEAKERVSVREMRKDKKVLKNQKKTYQKQMRRNRKHLFGRSTAPPA